jgi:hypothetical protein
MIFQAITAYKNREVSPKGKNEYLWHGYRSLDLIQGVAQVLD